MKNKVAVEISMKQEKLELAFPAAGGTNTRARAGLLHTVWEDGVHCATSQLRAAAWPFWLG